MSHAIRLRGRRFFLRFVVAAAVVAGNHAWAVNKCIGPGGGVTYQEAACPANAKDSQRVNAGANGVTDGAIGLWKFKRTHDDMTNKVSCLVISPISYPASPAPNGFYPVNAVVVVGKGGQTFGLRTSENRILFHNDLSGMGVKTNVGDFIPLSVKAGSHVVAPADSEVLLAQLEKARELQARVRFWPYEQLYDLKPFPMDGFASAVSRAKSCAASLN